MSFWTPIISVGGSLVVALVVSMFSRVTDKQRWLREERMKAYADYITSCEIFRQAQGQPVDGLNTLIAETENRSKLDLFGPKAVRAATKTMSEALGPIRLRKAFTEAEYGAYLNAKADLVTAQLKALGIKDATPDRLDSARISEWWQRDYGSPKQEPESS